MTQKGEISSLRRVFFSRPDRASTPIGSVIAAARRPYPLPEARFDPLPDFAGQTERLRSAASLAPAVGRLERDGAGFATAFLVTAAPPRMVTARHAVAGMISPGLSASKALIFEARGSDGTRAPTYLARDLAVNFADRPSSGDQRIGVKSIVWAHYIWDLAIFELDSAPPGVEPLAIEVSWRAREGERLAVLGYPMLRRAGDPRELEVAKQFFDDARLGSKHLSPGLCRPAASPAGFDPESAWGIDYCPGHDASTLPGSSGSPVIALETGKVVGVHFDGGRFQRDSGQALDPNHMVDLAFAIACEPRLGAELGGAATAAGPLVPRLHPVILGAETAAAEEEEALLAAAAWGARVKLNPLLGGIVADRPDFRDATYVPGPGRRRDSIAAPMVARADVAWQGTRPCCAAMAVGAVLETQLGARGRVSYRMLDALAREYDEWAEDTNRGTSLRAVVKALFHNGACPRGEGEASASGWTEPWILTHERAKAARGISLGRYLAVEPDLATMQCAVQEYGAVAVSARLHGGWRKPVKVKVPRGSREIRFDPDHPGPVRRGDGGRAHAFAVVGYDSEGFILRNSWGPGWSEWDGRPGHARWTYADWSETVLDAWVIRAAPAAPGAFGLAPNAAHAGDPPPEAFAHLPRPRRMTLLGHAIAVEREGVVDLGVFGLGLGGLRETGAILCDADYRTLMLAFPDPFLGTEPAARLAAHLAPKLKRAGIYPMFVIHGFDEIRAARLRFEAERLIVGKAYAASDQDPTGYLNRRAPTLLGRLLDDFVAGVGTAMAPGGGLWEALVALMTEPGLFDGSRFREDSTKGLGLGVLGLGCGSLAAEICAAALGLPEARVLRVAPPRDRGFGRLFAGDAPKPREAAPDGYRGDWIDIAAAALRATRPARGARGVPADFEADCVAPALIAALRTEFGR